MTVRFGKPDIDNGGGGRVHRVFRLQQEAGELRTAAFEDREHLIVPVVALVEGVIHPVNADTPELVLAEELKPTVGAWNGEPVCFDHPDIGGVRVSANDPRVLEQFMVGRLFNTKLEDLRLKTEAWLDLPRIAAMSGRAQELVDRINAGELVEVSVGAFVAAERKSGVHDGKRYAAVWREIGPDHLAMLPAGIAGACSVEMGCGAPRAASAGAGLLHVLSADGILMPTGVNEEGRVTGLNDAEGGPGKFATLAERFRGLGRFLLRDAQGDMSDNDLRQALSTALFSTEPAFLFIEAVFPAEQLVVYAVEPEGEFAWLERSFEINDAGDVTFGDSVEVIPTTTFEPVTAAAACGCDDPAVCQCGSQPNEETNMDKAQRIAALIANERTTFTAADEAGLVAMSDATLTALEESAVKEPETPVEPQAAAPADPVAPAAAAPAAPAVPAVPATPADPAAPVAPAEPKPDEPMTAAEWLAAAPPEIRAPLQRELTREAAARTLLVEELTTAQDVHTAEELGAMNIEELQKVQRLCNIGKPVGDVTPVDFGFGPPRASQAKGEDNSIDPAPSLRVAVAAAASK